MANIKSAKKKARQALRRRAVNQSRLSRLRSFVARVEDAIGGGNKAAAQAALKAAAPELMRGVGKGVIHKNAVARKLSRLSRRIKAL